MTKVKRPAMIRVNGRPRPQKRHCEEPATKQSCGLATKGQIATAFGLAMTRGKAQDGRIATAFGLAMTRGKAQDGRIAAAFGLAMT